MKPAPIPFLSVCRILVLACLGGALFFSSQLSAQEMTLRLTDVTPSSAALSGVKGPAVLFLEFDGGSAVAAKVMIPFDIASNSYRGNAEVFDLNAAGLTLSGSSLTGTATALVQAAGSGFLKNLSITLAATVSGGTVSGTYTGSFNSSSISGDITGESVAETPATSDVNVSLSLHEGMITTPGGVFTLGPESMRTWFEFSGGTLVDFDASSGRYRASLRSTDYDVVPVIGPRGDLDYGLVSSQSIASTSGTSATLGSDSFSAAFSAVFTDNQLTGRTFDYVLTGEVIGNTVLGTYTLSENGGLLRSDGSFVGYLGTGDPIPAETLPALNPLDPAADNENSGFTPPYFANISTAEIRERVKAGALWLTDCPEVSVFASEATASWIGATGDKQYDNAALNSYGGAAAFGVLHDLTADLELQAFSREAAARAGYWIDAQGTGKYQGLAEYYKGMFFVSVWGALAHMDLYETFGDQRWLDAVVNYMTFLQFQVTARMNGPSIWDPAPDDGVPAGRTWVMMQNDGTDIGVSNRRYIRDYDDMELHPAEFLWLLGKLRVDHGINTFATFEANAYQWVVDNLNDADMWKYRPEGPRNEPQAVGPTFFALYLLDYAPSYDPAVLTQVVDFIESTHIGWGHPVDDEGLRDAFSPYVRDFYPRQASGYLGVYVPSTASTSRMALVYLKRHQALGDPDDLAKAKAMTLSVLNRQQLNNGLLHHVGITTFSEDHQVRIIDGPNGSPITTVEPRGRIDQHPYTALKANTLRNLLDYADLIDALGEDCTNPQTLSGTGTIQKDPADPPFALTATASSGLPVEYEFIYGPASLAVDTITLDGTPGIVKVIASQPGDATWCEAASKSLFIAVGDQTPATPGSPVANGTDTTTVNVSWTDTSNNETFFRIEYREQGTTPWTTAGTAGANEISFAAGGLTSGLTYEFRVFSVNQVAESAASNIATGSPLEDAIFLFAEFECADGIGPGWAFWNNAQAGGGVELFATADQKSRDDIDPATITDIFFDIPVSATYALWIRGYTTAGGSSDSIWLKVDDGIHIGTGSDTFYGQSIFNAGFYGWKNNNDTFFLTAGQHKVTIAPREDGAVIDRIMLTTSTDIFTNLGIGDEAFNCGGSDEEKLYMLIKREVGSLQLEFYGESGYLYQVETATDLDGPWDEDDDLLYLGADAMITIPVADPAIREFYRIFRIPAP